MTISHCVGALRPARHTPVLSGDLEVTGTIRYERIRIETGGEIAGQVAVGAETEPAAKAPAKRKKGHVA